MLKMYVTFSSFSFWLLSGALLAESNSAVFWVEFQRGNHSTFYGIFMYLLFRMCSFVFVCLRPCSRIFTYI